MATKSTHETVRRSNRSNDEWDALARDVIVPALQAGTTMTELRAQYGAGVTIRKALSRIGYNTRGQKVTIGKTAGSQPKVLAKRVADRRAAGAAWWRLEMETGKSMDELKALLTKHGHDTVATGRVIISQRGLRKQAQAEAEAQAAAAKPARKRTRKAKVSA